MHFLEVTLDKSYGHILGVPKLRARLQKPQTALVVVSEDHSQISDLQKAPKDTFPIGNSFFLLLLDRLMRPKQLDPSANNSDTPSLQLEQRISFDTALVMLRLLSISIPVFTMGLTWPWIGPVVPATLVPYLVGILVQFKYEQIARYWKSPSWAAIPFIFHVFFFGRNISRCTLSLVGFLCVYYKLENLIRR
ncbi:hypothetical protein JHK85_047435 [Glycine max]|nr:hypothetical protein JHK86_046869 [Glycine max]KAG4942789.1 hypothetical protein JHK85_047435 [Glycine max]